MPRERLFINKRRRDKIFFGSSLHEQISRFSIHNQRLHPMYIEDAEQEGIKFETGFGNTDYLRTWPVLYGLHLS